ncbi:MAG: hypothetical protein KJO61_05175, partial [Deltaproteobacteria bacterium]|nr:hypothetical protein [Deltaproteobacteria bacterium]
MALKSKKRSINWKKVKKGGIHAPFFKNLTNVVKSPIVQLFGIIIVAYVAGFLTYHFMLENNQRFIIGHWPEGQVKTVKTTSNDLPSVSISDCHVNYMGKLIFKNEGDGKIENLIQWNDGESFLSLGIGHFIWFPKGVSGPYIEDFPKFIDHLNKKDYKLPSWLNSSSGCPWKDKDEFLENQNNAKMIILRNMMADTIPHQIDFLVKRFKKSLPKILATIKEEKRRENFKYQINRLSKTPKGLYLMIDYVNFKGEGIDPKEHYNNQGWGLLQVIEKMR